MKKTIAINLGGMVFNIDEDAYHRLRSYLNKLEAHFGYGTEAKEISLDVEARIAELLKSKKPQANAVITLEDIDEVIHTMGEPTDFEKGSNSESYQYTSYQSSYRRMYRDPDSRVIGGVCSGLSAYFHIDPIILRLLFVILFLGFGTGLLIYIILWIVLPAANTVAEKLEMRGEKVNINNIKNAMRNEFNDVKNNMGF